MRIPRHPLTRLSLATAGATLVLATSVGLVSAQTTPTPTPTTTATTTPTTSAAARHQAVLADAAQQLGITTQQLAQAIKQAKAAEKSAGATGVAARQAALAAAAQQLGISTQQLTQALQQARKDQGVHPALRLAQLVRAERQVAAQTIGISLQQLRQQLNGQTLTSVATANNVAPSTVSDAITTDLDNKINAAVSAGTIQSSQANNLEQRVPTFVNKLMSRTFHTRASK